MMLFLVGDDCWLYAQTVLVAGFLVGRVQASRIQNLQVLASNPICACLKVDGYLMADACLRACGNQDACLHMLYPVTPCAPTNPKLFTPAVYPATHMPISMCTHAHTHAQVCASLRVLGVRAKLQALEAAADGDMLISMNKVINALHDEEVAVGSS